MTREEVKSCIGTIEMLQRLAYNIHGVMDVIDVDNCKKIIKALEQEPTTKNDLEVDCIDRAELLKAMDTWDKFGYTETGCFVRAPKNDYVPYVHYEDMVYCVKGMPSVTPPQEPQSFKWCTDCREYDQEKHCCHRWSKVIRNTVEEMKQEYIEREVLDKIRAEIDNALSDGMIHKKTVLGIIDKYKTETEQADGNDD